MIDEADTLTHGPDCIAGALGGKHPYGLLIGHGTEKGEHFCNLGEKDLAAMKTRKDLVWFHACYCGLGLTKVLAKSWKTTTVGFETITVCDVKTGKVVTFVRDMMTKFGHKAKDSDFQEALRDEMEAHLRKEAEKLDLTFFMAASTVTLHMRAFNGR